MRRLPLLCLAASIFSPFGPLATYAEAQAQPAPVSTTAPEASYNAVADPKAVVQFGHARFTVLTPQLIRMEWAADQKFEDHPSLVFLNRRLPVPDFSAKRHGKQLVLTTHDLTLTYTDRGDGRFTADNLSIVLSLEGKPVSWHPGLADTGNLLGTTRTLDRALGDKTQEPIGEGLVSRNGWVLVDDSQRPLFDSDNFTFAQGENSEWPWVMERPSGSRLDWYFFGYGHNYRQALQDYVTVAGRIPLPPRFAFGAWWSRYWAYSDQELNQLVDGFHQNNVPLDVLVIDMDWHLNKRQLEAMHETDQSDHDLGWSGYTWNPLLFPDPKAFLDHIHDEGLKATLNLHPASGVQPWESAYPAMAKAMGIDPATRKYVPFDITNKKFALNYMDLLHHPLEKQGINFWWLDWQQESDSKIAGINNTWWLNYVHFTDQEREGKRPLLFHRWGGLGNHRYQIGFSGDTVSVWPSLAFQPWFTATAANVGYAYWSHDIGGHMPGAVSPELYTRWIQFGAFSPILRTHTTKNPDSERRIWAYPEPYADIMRATFRQRYAMEPYIYTEARRTYDTGVAFFHPLYYDWPDADAAYTTKNEYVFGSQMIVAPVASPEDTTTHLAKESIWIPEGTWIERASGQAFAGPRTIERSFSIDQIPVYVRSGAIVPMQPPMQYTGEKPVDPLILNIYPLADGQHSNYRLYEDASDSESYKNGVCAWTPISASQSGDALTVSVAPVEGTYPGMLESRGYELRLPGDWPPASVTVNGTDLAQQGGSWSYDGNTLTTIIRIPSRSTHNALSVEIHRASGSLTARGQLNGFAGSIDRLRAAYDAVNAMWPFTWSPAPLIDASQTGDRLHYHPETAQSEIARFPPIYQQALQQLQDLADKANVPDEQLAKQLGENISAEKAQSYRASLARALALLHDGNPAH
ncbi:TIM-barrel domain-containing protein [Silvibacterium sp.]|uniref:glycoside hydrolase family 31 protein n=1 Tax=Silvibacterium sp. TaxID=1964179 RepID=UPI0039E61814